MMIGVIYDPEERYKDMLRGKSSWSIRIGYLTVFLMIFSTGANQGIRYAIFFAFLMLLAIRPALGRNRITLPTIPSLMLFTFYYMLIGLGYVSYGLVMNNPGALFSIQAYVIYPLLLFIALQFSCDERFIFGLPLVIAISGIAVSLYGFLLLGGAAGLISEFLVIDIGLTSTVYAQDRYFGMGLATVLPMIFIVPFMIALLMLRYIDDYKLVDSWVLLVAIGGSIMFSVLTGRRSLWVVIALSPIVTFAFLAIKQGVATFLWKGVLITLMTILLGFFAWEGANLVIGNQFGADMTQRLESLFYMFSFDLDSSIAHKQIQTVRMIESWGERPLFGYGHGAAVQGFFSNSEYAYEAQYALLLHNTGIIGFMAYAAGVTWIYWKAYKIIRRNGRMSNLMIAVMVGFSSFLMANMTNPYFGKIDSLWILFYPLDIINIVFLRREANL